MFLIWSVMFWQKAVISIMVILTEQENLSLSHITAASLHHIITPCYHYFQGNDRGCEYKAEPSTSSLLQQLFQRRVQRT